MNYVFIKNGLAIVVPGYRVSVLQDEKVLVIHCTTM